MAAPKGNQYALGNTGGKPRKYTEEEIANNFNIYITYCIENNRFANTAGFRRHSGMAHTTYYDYEKEFPNTFKKMDDILEDETLNSDRHPSEKIFYLKNKFGYADKQEIASKNDTTLHVTMGGQLKEWSE